LFGEHGALFRRRAKGPHLLRRPRWASWKSHCHPLGAGRPTVALDFFAPAIIIPRVPAGSFNRGGGASSRRAHLGPDGAHCYGGWSVGLARDLYRGRRGAQRRLILTSHIPRDPKTGSWERLDRDLRLPVLNWGRSPKPQAGFHGRPAAGLVVLNRSCFRRPAPGARILAQAGRGNLCGIRCRPLPPRPHLACRGATPTSTRCEKNDPQPPRGGIGGVCQQGRPETGTDGRPACSTPSSFAPFVEAVFQRMAGHAATRKNWAGAKLLAQVCRTSFPAVEVTFSQYLQDMFPTAVSGVKGANSIQAVNGNGPPKA